MYKRKIYTLAGFEPAFFCAKGAVVSSGKLQPTDQVRSNCDFKRKIFCHESSKSFHNCSFVSKHKQSDFCKESNEFLLIEIFLFYFRCPLIKKERNYLLSSGRNSCGQTYHQFDPKMKEKRNFILRHTHQSFKTTISYLRASKH